MEIERSKARFGVTAPLRVFLFLLVHKSINRFLNFKVYPSLLVYLCKLKFKGHGRLRQDNERKGQKT